MLTREEIKEFERLVDKIFEARQIESHLMAEENKVLEEQKRIKKGEAVITCYLCSGNFQLRTVYQVNERYVCEECAGKVYGCYAGRHSG